MAVMRLTSSHRFPILKITQGSTRLQKFGSRADRGLTQEQRVPSWVRPRTPAALVWAVHRKARGSLRVGRAGAGAPHPRPEEPERCTAPGSSRLAGQAAPRRGGRAPPAPRVGSRAGDRRKAAFAEEKEIATTAAAAPAARSLTRLPAPAAENAE